MCVCLCVHAHTCTQQAECSLNETQVIVQIHAHIHTCVCFSLVISSAQEATLTQPTGVFFFFAARELTPVLNPNRPQGDASSRK